MSDASIFIRGYMKSKRHHASTGSITSALSGRWTQRFIVVYGEHFIDSKDEAQTVEVHRLDFRSVKDIRWATQTESRAGFGVLSDTLVDTMRAIVGNRPTSVERRHSTHATTRFVIEVEGETDTSEPALMYEAETPSEAMRWFVVMSERIHAIAGQPHHSCQGRRRPRHSPSVRFG